MLLEVLLGLLAPQSVEVHVVNHRSERLAHAQVSMLRNGVAVPPVQMTRHAGRVWFTVECTEEIKFRAYWTSGSLRNFSPPTGCIAGQRIVSLKFRPAGRPVRRSARRPAR